MHTDPSSQFHKPCHVIDIYGVAFLTCKRTRDVECLPDFEPHMKFCILGKHVHGVLSRVTPKDSYVRPDFIFSCHQPFYGNVRTWDTHPLRMYQVCDDIEPHHVGMEFAYGPVFCAPASCPRSESRTYGDYRSLGAVQPSTSSRTA